MSAVGNGLPHFPGLLTTIAPSGFRHPFVRRNWMRFGKMVLPSF